MKNFINLIESLIEGKIDFKEFDRNWQKLYLGSQDNTELYENLTDSEKDFLDEIHDKEDMVAYREEEVKELKQYMFMSVDEFIDWLKEFKQKNKEMWQ